jgi:hypothetical protein
MATVQEINNHDALINRLVTQFGKGISPLLTQLYDSLITEEVVDRLTVQRLFVALRTYIQTQINQLDQVLLDNDTMNSEVLGDITVDTVRLKNEALASMNAALDEEQNNIIGVIATSALVGAVGAQTLRALRGSKTAIINRLKIAFGSNIRSVDGAYTLLKSLATGQKIKYRYVGGVIAESRPFCKTHNGTVMTEREIRRIWNNQTWQGKKPGDPFVVRGGYNCRHMFVPVREDE